MKRRLPFRLPCACLLGALGLLRLHAGPPFPTQITVNLTPLGAVTAGAAWRLVGEPDWRPGGVAQTNIQPGTLLLEFRDVPGWETPAQRTVILPTETVVVLSSVEYVARPRFPLDLTATSGGFLHAEAWSPTGFDAVDGLNRPSSFAWESAVRFPRVPRMPTNNVGWRVRVYALAFPHHRFVGWEGDLSGLRNPVTLIMNRPYRVKALFDRAQGLAPATAVQAAGDYHAPGSLVVHGQFVYEPADRLRELRWRPQLPAGWSLVAVSGLGEPVIQDGEIIFSGLLGHNPLHFNMTVAVPADETGRRALGGEVEFAFVGGTNSFVRPVRSLLTLSDELVVNPRSSPAAQLALSHAQGLPVLEIRGEIGRTYTLQQVPEFLSNFDRFWWFLGDVTLTNSAQTWVDETFAGAPRSAMYRAVLLE